MTKKVVFCVPSLHGPTAPFIDSLEASIPLVIEAGWDEGAVEERGCPYISAARAKMLRKALDAKADVIVFLDYDLSWDPEDLLTLIETEGEVVAGTYRYKKDELQYMGAIETDARDRPITRADGCIQAHSVPGGFLKITKGAVDRFMRGYPQLIYGVRYNPTIDLFNHGAYDGVWWGEDVAFSRNWRALGRDIWLVPDLNINHHSAEKAYSGNFHRYLLMQPGGSEYSEEK